MTKQSDFRLASTALPLDRSGKLHAYVNLDPSTFRAEPKIPPRKVLIQGAFDILNVGHVRVFQFAKSQGDYLIVALNTNELIADYKKREAVQPWEHKAEIIRACRFVDDVIQAPHFSPLELLKAHNVDVYVVADEWVSTKGAEIAYMEAKGGCVAVAPRFTDISTSEIKRRLLAEAERGKAAEIAA